MAPGMRFELMRPETAVFETVSVATWIPRLDRDNICTGLFGFNVN